MSARKEVVEVASASSSTGTGSTTSSGIHLPGVARESHRKRVALLLGRQENKRQEKGSTRKIWKKKIKEK